MLAPIWLFRAGRAMVRLVRDPTRLEEVFVLASGAESRPEIAEKITGSLAAHPEHRKALAEKPRLGKIDLAALEKLPPGTLGRAFAADVRRTGIDLDDIQKIEDPKTDFDWVRSHMRETHDVWHTATGFDTDVAGELGLQAFYLAQLEAPLSPLLLSIGFLNTYFYAMDDRDHRMREIVRGWLMGRRAKSLFGVRWAEMWELPLEEVRRRLDLRLDELQAAIERFDVAALETDGEAALAA